MSKIIVSIVIVTYNSKEYLIGCLSSISASLTKTNYEIIVIDNASRDNTYHSVSPQFPNVKFIYNNINNGFAYANNQGIAIAEGKYLLLLNPDTLIVNNAIDTMVDFLESNENAGACGCKVLNDDGSLQPSFFGFPTLIKEVGHLFRIDRMRWLYGILKSSKLLSKIARTNLAVLHAADSVMEVDYLLGACLMIKASVIDRVGPLDDKIFMYIEDTEICYRIRANGYGVYYVPQGEIVHFGGKSSATDDKRMLMEYTRSRLYFYRKCYGNIKTYALKSIILTDMLFKMMTIWFVKYQMEMQQLQTRYTNTVDSDEYPSYIATIPNRIDSFRLYGSILKMAITY
jgi:GT2 family glycosyltransferase